MKKRMAVLTVSLAFVLVGCAGAGSSPTPIGIPSTPTTTPYSLLVPAYGSITWERSGGIAGLCQQLVVRADGSYVLDDTCRSTEPQMGRLSQDEADQLTTWLATYQAFDWATPAEPGTADMFSVTLQFLGTGTMPPPAAVQSRIAMAVGEWASSLTTPATPVPIPASGEGILGQATIGPTCPVARAEDPCPDQPYQGTLQILDANGNLLTEVTTAADGSFSVVLPPGDYIVQGEGGNPLPSASRVDVAVVAGQFTEVHLAFDTGIR